MRVLLVALLAAISYAQTDDEWGVNTNTHVIGLNGCDGHAEMPKFRHENSPVSTFFYSMKASDIPGFQYNEAENSVTLPFGELWTGWYYRHSDLDTNHFEDAGIFEWYPAVKDSLFSDTNYGFAENLMTVLADGELGRNLHADMEKSAKEEDATYEWSPEYGKDFDRRRIVNAHIAISQAALQFADLALDRVQTADVRANPNPIPDFAEWQEKLASKIPSDFDLSEEYPAQKIATNCLHGLSGNVMEDTFTIDLDTETIIYKGQTIFAFRIWTNIAGRAVWKYDESTGTLSLLLHAFQMGLMDATKHPIELKYFQSAPFTEEDNRVNNYVPSNDVKYKLVCGSTNLLKFMPWDTHLFWQSQEEICPEEMMNEFIQKVEDTQFIKILTDRFNVARQLTLLDVGSKYVVCAVNYMRSYVPYSHGYGILETGVWMHFLIEILPHLMRDLLENPDINSFKIDYIYSRAALAAKDSESEVAKMNKENSRLRQANKALRKALEKMTN